MQYLYYVGKKKYLSDFFFKVLGKLYLGPK